jgi:SAM-dependent methyltransferase
MCEPDVCAVCSTGVMLNGFTAQPLDYSSEHNCIISICSNCGYGKTIAFARPSATLYEGGCYDEKERAWHKILLPLLILLERGKLKYFGPERAGKALLEIGCGKGRFMEAAKNAGLMAYGIEPSPRSYAFASTRLGEAVASVGVEQIDQVSSFPKKYDYVMLWHVLEHLDDPHYILLKIRSLLANGGRVVIAVPNFASLQARQGRADWYHLDPPRHVHHFSPGNLEILASGAGFVVERLCFDSLYQNFVGDITTLVNKFTPAKNSVFNGLRLNKAYFDRLGHRKAWAAIVLSSIMTLFVAIPVLLFTICTQIIGKSGTMVLVLKPT